MKPIERLFLMIVLVVAAALRVAVILCSMKDPKTIFYAPDQSFTVDLATSSWPGLVAGTAKDTHPPLYYALVKIWFWLTPHTLQWAQAFSVVISVLILLVVFFMAREMFSPAAGWIALIFSSFAPYQIFWGPVARNHQLLALAVPLAVWTGYRWTRRPTHARWWAMAGAVGLMVNTNYIGLIVTPVWVAAFALLEPMPWRRRIQTAAAVVPGLIAFVPWTPIMMQQIHGGPMNHTFFQETVFPFLLFFHSIFGRMQAYQAPLPIALNILLQLLFALVFVAGLRAAGKRWSWWLLMIGMPTLPVAIAYCSNFTLAERHINFAVPVFMAYWGAAVEQSWMVTRSRVMSRTA